MTNILITGGGRGLGLELARQFLRAAESKPERVYVTTRAVSNDLQKLMDDSGGRLANIHCEPTNDASVARAAAELDAHLGGQGLDILINNIGVSPFPLLSLPRARCAALPIAAALEPEGGRVDERGNHSAITLESHYANLSQALSSRPCD